MAYLTPGTSNSGSIDNNYFIQKNKELDEWWRKEFSFVVSTINGK